MNNGYPSGTTSNDIDAIFEQFTPEESIEQLEKYLAVARTTEWHEYVIEYYEQSQREWIEKGYEPEPFQTWLNQQTTKTINDIFMYRSEE